MKKRETDMMHRFKTEEILCDPGPARMFADTKDRTFVVTLGTSTPSPNPYRLGAAGAVVVDHYPYLIDAGEGVIRAIAKAATAHGRFLVDSFAPKKLTTLFITHLHSDHIVGLSSLILNPWIFGRTEPMTIYGPEGTKELVDHLLKAHERDIHERINGAERSNDTGWRVEVHEITESRVVHTDERITVEAFFHPHGTIANLGYKFTSSDKSVVWAGDGKINEEFADACHGVDMLVTEICSQETLPNAPWGGLSEQEKEDIIWSYHLKPSELAELADREGIGRLILIHESNYSLPYRSEALFEEMRTYYSGEMVSSRDADVF
ncbi:MAG: MBL fold metallo-hydrolase [Sphaerochaetaceae bacterium]|nr:MBL fold metallo-hydrolase [Sphaerochaetaceae bacterium]